MRNNKSKLAPTLEDIQTFIRILDYGARTNTDTGGLTIALPITLGAVEWATLAEINDIEHVNDLEKPEDFGDIISNVLKEIDLDSFRQRLLEAAFARTIEQVKSSSPPPR